MSHYDIMQVCKRGHIITRYAGNQPEHRQDYCDKCGSETIMECSACDTFIRGEYLGSFGSVGPGIPAPRHCHACGKPFPWTETAINAAIELLAEQLTEEDPDQIRDAVEAVVRDTERAEVGGLRLRRWLEGGTAAVRDSTERILTGVISDVSKRAIFGPGG